MTRRLATAQASYLSRLTNHESQLCHVVVMAATSHSRLVTSHADTGTVLNVFTVAVVVVVVVVLHLVS